MPFIFYLFFISLTYANLFTITDTQGNVLKSKHISHTPNAFLNQKASEYSLQALLDELRKEVNKVRRSKQQQDIASTKPTEKKPYKLTPTLEQKLLNDATYFKGGKYVWGGTSPNGFDCSGYVQYLYKKHNIKLPRTAYAQSKEGIKVPKNSLKKGDLLFFLTDKSRGIPVTHVGIYIGNQEFIHAASSKKGIIISPINHGYYSKKFLFAKRVLKQNS
jgi:cell wall-associated NlpC family hydrolase